MGPYLYRGISFLWLWFLQHGCNLCGLRAHYICVSHFLSLPFSGFLSRSPEGTEMNGKKKRRTTTKPTQRGHFVLRFPFPLAIIRRVIVVSPGAGGIFYPP